MGLTILLLAIGAMGLQHIFGRCFLYILGALVKLLLRFVVITAVAVVAVIMQIKALINRVSEEDNADTVENVPELIA